MFFLEDESSILPTTTLETTLDKFTRSSNDLIVWSDDLFYHISSPLMHAYIYNVWSGTLFGFSSQGSLYIFITWLLPWVMGHKNNRKILAEPKVHTACVLECSRTSPDYSLCTCWHFVFTGAQIPLGTDSLL